MDIQHKDNGANGAFYLENNGQVVGQIDYIWMDSDTIAINHTEVSESYEGHGLGRELVNSVVRMARRDDLKIIPVCPFAKEVMESSDSYNDVLK